MRRIIIFFNILILVATNITNVYAQETSTVTDSRDGNIYKTVKIGNQVWMAENMRFQPSNNCLCYRYFELNPDLVYTYGYLYDWETAFFDACPSGWHLPSNGEWQELVGFLGGKTIAGRKMTKILHDRGELSNSSGFSALSFGYCDANEDKYDDRGTSASFWSSSQSGNSASYRAVSLHGVYCNGGYAKQRGFSVRCIRD